MRPTSLIALFLLSTTLQAAEPHYTAFTHANLIDGTGSPPQADTTLIIHDHTIATIGPTKTTPIPDDATTIDATNKTLIPALICAHAHLGLAKGTAASPKNLTEENITRQLHLYARYGVGAIASLGLDHDSIFPLRAARNAHALPDSPRILSAVHGFTAPQGGPGPSFGDQLDRPTTPEEARQQVDALANAPQGHRPDLIKIWLDDFGGSQKRLPPEIYTAIIEQAHKHHLPVFAHVYYLADAKSIVSAGVDALAHSVRDRPVDNGLIDSMKSHHTYCIPTLDMIEVNFVYADKPDWMTTPFFTSATEPGLLAYLASPKYSPHNQDRKVLRQAQQNLKTLFDAGVPIAFGTDSGAAAVRVQGFAEHRELQLMVQAGLTPVQVIHAATQTSAEVLRIADTTGILRPNKSADLILLDADPTENIANTQRIHAIYLDGRPVPLRP